MVRFPSVRAVRFLAAQLLCNTGATLSVGATASVLIASYQTIADNGTLSFGTGDTVTFGGAATIAVNPSGTLTASGDTFTTNGSGNNYLQVYSGGETHRQQQHLRPQPRSPGPRAA